MQDLSSVARGPALGDRRAKEGLPRRSSDAPVFRLRRGAKAGQIVIFPRYVPKTSLSTSEISPSVA